jgi:hypothetical protein
MQHALFIRSKPTRLFHSNESKTLFSGRPVQHASFIHAVCRGSACSIKTRGHEERCKVGGGEKHFTLWQKLTCQNERPEIDLVFDEWIVPDRIRVLLTKSAFTVRYQSRKMNG